MQGAQPSVDITECDREPIHIPGLVQSFGCLVAFSLPTWIISNVSLNALTLFQVASEDVLIGKSIDAILTPKIIHDLRNTFQAAMISGFSERLGNVRLGATQDEYDILIHNSGQLAVAEFIPVSGADATRTDPVTLVKTIIDRLRRTTSFQSFLTSAVRQVRAVTGFDRVMIYKFLEDDSGKVVAESARAGLSPFLDLHFPATDIPSQARALFSRQWLRMIPDAEAKPVAIVPSLATNGSPIDLTLSTLRSASPVHLQYLHNMGVRASLTASIISNDRLWGLIACHHETPRRISASISASIELFAQVFSTQIETKQQRDEMAYLARARETHDRLIAAMSPEETIFQNLDRYDPLLRELIPCDGIGVWSENRLDCVGVAPPEDAIPELIRFLNGKRADRCFATSELGKQLPDAIRYADRVSGLIAIPFASAPKDFVILFRREIVQTVMWGGDPNKAVQAEGTAQALSPRHSFQAWKELVKQRSIAWLPAELDVAESFRIALLDMILRRANLIDRERRIAQEGQLLLVAELNHRVKNVLAVIRSLVRQSQHGAASFESFTADLQARIQAMSIAHDQLTQSHWKAAPLSELIEAEAQAWTTATDEHLILEGPSVMLESRAYQTLALVLHELMTNAAKHGALSVKEGHLTISWCLNETGDLKLTWLERNGPPVSPPTRRGFGSVLVEQSIPFELQGDAHISYERAGVEASFRIPRDFVQKGVDTPRKREHIPSRHADLNGKNLLLVEDSMMIALDAQTMLQNCGAEVELAANTSDARRAIALHKFDAAILDVNLYTENSFPIADHLQEQDIPFVFATGYGETVTVPDRFKHIHVVSKPYAEDALKAALAA